MIFATVLTTLGDNQYMIITSLGTSSLAYGLVPEEELIMGEAVGVIQCGDVFSVYRYGRRLRCIHAVTDEQAKALAAENTEWQWQYLAARVGLEAGNLVRLYELAEVQSVAGNLVTATLRGEQSTIVAADWVAGIEAGDMVVVDNELGQIVGFACVKSLRYAARYNYCLKVQLCDASGNPIAASVPVEITRNSYDTESGSSEIMSSDDDGLLTISGFLPADELTLKYSHGSSDYQHVCEISLPAGAEAKGGQIEHIALQSIDDAGRFTGLMRLGLDVKNSVVVAVSIELAGIGQSKQAQDFGAFSFTADNTGSGSYVLANGIRLSFAYLAQELFDYGDEQGYSAYITGQGLGNHTKNLDDGKVCYSGQGSGLVLLLQAGDAQGEVNVSAKIEKIHATAYLNLLPYKPEVLP